MSQSRDPIVPFERQGIGGLDAAQICTEPRQFNDALLSVVCTYFQWPHDPNLSVDYMEFRDVFDLSLPKPAL